MTVRVFLTGSIEPHDGDGPPLPGWRDELTALLYESRSENERSNPRITPHQDAPVLQLAGVSTMAVNAMEQQQKIYRALDERLREVRDTLVEETRRALRADQGRIETLYSAAYELRLRRGRGEHAFPRVRTLGEWDAARIGMESCRLVVVHTLPGGETQDRESRTHIGIARRLGKPVLRIADPGVQHDDDMVDTIEQAADLIRMMFLSTARVR